MNKLFGIDGKKIKVLLLVFEALLLLGFRWSTLSVIAVIISSNYIFDLLLNSSDKLALREFILTLFSLNYLMAPAMMYNALEIKFSFFAMDIPSEDYFSLAIPGILFFHLGISILKNKIFDINISNLKNAVFGNELLLKYAIVAGVVINLLSASIGGDLKFFLYLFSAVRFIAVFALTASNFKKHWPYIAFVLLLEAYSSIRAGAFHDTLIWMIFYGIFLFRLYSPSLKFKLGVVTAAVLFVFILQITKEVYRAKTWTGQEEGGLTSFNKALSVTTEGNEELLSSENISASLIRINQGFIFASTVNNLNNTKDYQGWTLLNKYLEAAFLPRFLAPNKLAAGEGELFNRFSGRLINSTTTMSLGILADGYISFNTYGVYIFGFFLGLVFSVVFKIIELWSHTSIFFLLFLFPVLHYPIRPDVETQTILGHFVKAMFFYSLLFFFYRKRFNREGTLAGSYT